MNQTGDIGSYELICGIPLLAIAPVYFRKFFRCACSGVGMSGKELNCLSIWVNMIHMNCFKFAVCKKTSK